MHLGKKPPKLPDLSSSLWDADSFTPRTIRRLGLNGDVTAIGIEPLSGILALGTDRGSVHLFGAPSVGTELAVQGAPRRRVRFVAFVQLSARMCVVDSKNCLSVYDLTAPKRPALCGSYDVPQAVNAITTSPSHTHAFLALADGQCLVYDVDRAQVSPYGIPNLWASEEAKGGVFRSRQMAANPALIDIIIHPRDLNTLLLVYDAGVILWDLNNRSIIRKFDQIVRNEEVHTITSAAVHPLGIMFAVGHLGGHLSFWSLDHGDQALAVHHLPSPASSPASSGRDREPIFRLAWSSFPNLEECKVLLSMDPSASSQSPPIPRLVGATLDYAGGETVLTVLGGLLLDEQPGVTMLQFAPLHLDPAVNPATVEPMLYLAGLANQVEPIGMERSSTPYPVDDFVLLPRSNPHFNGSHDPIALLQLFKYPGGGRVGPRPYLSATEFPPPLTPSPQHTSSSAFVPGAHPRVTPFNVSLSDVPYSPSSFRLPAAIFTGPDTVNGAQMIKLDRDDFSSLIREWVDRGANEDADGVSDLRRLPLRAGEAHGESESSVASSRQPYQVLITHHPDLSIRFHDSSTQLLTAHSPTSSALRFEYPQIIPHLQISLSPLLRDPSISQLLPPPADLSIQRVHLSPDARYIAVALNSGQVVLYKFKDEATYARDAEARLGDLGDIGDEDPEQNALVQLDDLKKFKRDGYYPLALLDARSGQVLNVAVSNGGLHAIAFEDGSLAVFDARSLRLLTRAELGIVDGKSNLKKLAKDPIAVMQWRDDASPHTLDVIRSGGHAYEMTFTPTNQSNKYHTVSTFERPIKTGLSDATYLFEIDAREVERGLNAPLAYLSLSDNSKKSSSGLGGMGMGFWIVCNQKEARCFTRETNERVGKVDFVASARHAQLVEKGGSYALIVWTSAGASGADGNEGVREVQSYAVPSLAFMHRVALGEGAEEHAELSSDISGDFLSYIPPSALPPHYPFPLTLSTLFSTRRLRIPTVNFAEPEWPMPPQPGPPSVEGSYVAWIWGPKVWGGREIDALLAGPDRPPPKDGKPPRTNALAFGEFFASVTSPSPSSETPPDSSTSTAPPRPSRASRPPARSSSAASGSTGSGIYNSAQDLYTRLSNAVAERGEALSGLGDSVSGLENSSKGLADEAKRVAGKGNLARKFFF